MKIMHMGDSHAKPGITNRRYTWAARCAVEMGVDAIVCAGDWWDFPSLCSYDKGTTGFEGRRYQADVDVGVDAMERMAEVFAKSGHTPKLYRTRGNHCHRVQRYLDAEPLLEGGPVGFHNLREAEFGWEVSPFLTPLMLGGVLWVHYATSGVMNRPVGGAHHAASLIKATGMSTAVGHSHLFDFATTTNALGQRIYGLVSGCYFEHEEAYAGPSNRRYARGLSILHRCKAGEFDLQWLSLDHVRNTYGKRARRYVGEV